MKATSTSKKSFTEYNFEVVLDDEMFFATVRVNPEGKWVHQVIVDGGSDIEIEPDDDPIYDKIFNYLVESKLLPRSLE